MPHTFETGPIEVERFYTGVISQRNRLAVPIRIFGRRLIELYDAILSGSNAEITVRSTLQRAAGFIPYNSNAITGIPQKFFTFQPVSTGTLLPIVDTTTGVYQLSPTGAATTIQTKTQAKQSSFFAVGNYLYIGNPEFSKKWDTGAPQGTTNWGIAIGSVNNITGPNTCGAGTDVNVFGGVAWTNPNNVTSAVSYATAAIPGRSFTHQDQCTQFGFAIPSTNTILGILITLDVISPDSVTSFSATLMRGGNTTGLPRAVIPGAATTTITFGGTSDLWGTNWVANDINQTNWGVAIVATDGNVAANVSIRNCRATIYSLGGPTVTLVAGTLTAQQGFQYVFCYGNSTDNNISNPTPVSNSIKPVAQGVQISLTASTDPQVNQIRVFRTTDTGTGAVFFELPTSPYPNTTTMVVDNAADNALQVTQAVTLNSLAFSPPPTGLVNIEWYAGRLWGSVGNLLYFSAGPDNFPMGRGTSNWPPANVFELPTQIVKNVALNGGNGMLSITLDTIHIAQGIANPGFTVNKWLSDIGARQQNAVDTDGSNIYLFTPDRQFLKISSQGIEELSQNISDQTDLFDPTKVYVCQHRSGSQDSRVFLTDGSTQWLPYNLMMGAWEPARTLADGSGMGAISSIEISAGVYKLLKGSTAAGQIIEQRDLTTFSDNGSNYGFNVVFGNIPIADPSQLANIENLVGRFTNVGNLPAVSILPNDISGAFVTIPRSVNEPPEASNPPTGHFAFRWYLNDAPIWTQMSSLQIKFAWPADPFQEEMLSWGLFPNQSADERPGAIPQIQGR